MFQSELNTVMHYTSDGYRVRDIRLHWLRDPGCVMMPGITQPEFDILGLRTYSFETVYTSGTFGALEVEVTLQRRLTVYLLSVYIPSALVVGLSWMSFWIDMDSVPARTTLAIITILTITTQTFSNTRGMFTTSIVKALDVWMAVCLIYVFGAFLEFAVVNTLHRRTKSSTNNTVKKGLEEKNGTIAKKGDDLEPDKCLAMADVISPNLDGTKISHRLTGERRAQYIEDISQVAFPLTFVIFNCIYWPIYLIPSLTGA